MASVHKLPGKPNWYCSLTLEGGKRTFRSSHLKSTEKTRAEAVALCEKWQREIDIVQKAQSTEATPLKLDNRQELIEGFISATQKVVQGTFTTAHGQTLLNKILEAGNQTPLTQTSIADFLNGWANSKTVSKAKGTGLRYQHTVRTFLDHLGKRSKSNISGLAPRDFEQFRDLQIKEGKSPATANMVIKTLRIPLNLARRQGLLLTNPAEAVDLLDSDGVTRDVFSVDQLRALMKTRDRDWRGMILMGGTTGCRIGDAARMTWANVDLQKNLVNYFPQKNMRGVARKQVVAIMLPEFKKFLLSHPIGKDVPSAPLFPSLYAKPVSGDYGLSLTFRGLMDTAGVQYEALRDNVKGKGRKFYNLGFHSLRHSFVSTLANLGVPEEIRRKLVGHASVNVHQTYTHLEQKTIAKALKKFPRLLGPS